MSRTSHRADGDIVREFLSVADLLEKPQLAQMYAYLTREEEATVQDVMDDLEFAQGTAYSYANRLVEAGVVEVTHDEQPRRYAARKIDLTVTTTAGDREYTITPALIDAVGRRETNADIDTYIDRHGVAGLATALTYAVARERGEVTHRLMAADLDLSPLAAELILQALQPVVHEHYDIEEAGAGLDGLDIDDDEFEERNDTERIVLFLDRNDDRAWKAAMIAERLGLETDAVSAILSRLKERGLVRHKRPYWAITDDKERLEAAYRLHQYHESADEQYGEEHLEELQTDEMEEVR